MRMAVRSCAWCSAEFESRWSSAKFCSDECRTSATRKRLAAYQREHYRKHRQGSAEEQTRLRHLRYQRKYGISEEQFLKMEADQDHACAICGDPPNGKGRFHVDHDAKTGRVRGLLCARCNLGIGCFLDSPDRLHAAIDYLS